MEFSFVCVFVCAILWIAISLQELEVFQLCRSCQNKSLGEHCSVRQKKVLFDVSQWPIYLEAHMCIPQNAVYFWHAYGVEPVYLCVWMYLCTFDMPMYFRTCVLVCLDVPVYF